MSTAKMVALMFFFMAIVLFVLVGFDIVKSTDFNLIALGLASTVVGFVVFHYVP